MLKSPSTIRTDQFHEGYLTGKAKDLKLDMQIFSFAFDEKHQPSGLWTCRLNRPSEQWMFCIRYADGKLQESYTENMQTGDRTGQPTGVGADDGEVGRPLLQEINKLLLQPYEKPTCMIMRWKFGRSSRVFRMKQRGGLDEANPCFASGKVRRGYWRVCLYKSCMFIHDIGDISLTS